MCDLKLIGLLISNNMAILLSQKKGQNKKGML